MSPIGDSTLREPTAKWFPPKIEEVLIVPAWSLRCAPCFWVSHFWQELIPQVLEDETYHNVLLDPELVCNEAGV